MKSWDEPSGPAILKTLSAAKPVSQVANAKAYEMLSTLVGLCELARVTGDQSLVAAARHAWQDIVDHRLYVTGSASQHGQAARADSVLGGSPLGNDRRARRLPATTATTGNPRRLTAGDNEFTLRLATPATFVAVRVIGVPASGDNPRQAFSSCGELQAFAH